MKYTMYSVKDVMTGMFKAPVLMMNDNEAIRQFKTQANHIDLWKDNPGDFELWKIGTFEEENGEIHSLYEKIIGARSVLE